MRRPVLALAATLVAVAVALPAAPAPADPDDQSQASRKKRGKLRGKVRVGHLPRRTLRRSRRRLRRLKRKLEEVDRPRRTPVEGPGRPPFGPPLADPGGRASLRSSPFAHAAASSDFNLFRSNDVLLGSNGTSQVAEPTWANDRNAVLFTGNWHAALSSDNGYSWTYLDPEAEFGAGEEFCCDQVALSVDRGRYSMIVWLLQSDEKDGFVKLLVYQGRDELLDQTGYCEWNAFPHDFGFPQSDYNFDFNEMATTDKYLYVSSNVYKRKKKKGKKAKNKYKDSVVWRVELDDLDREDCVTLNADSFTGGDTDFTPGLVKGAGSTMYWASHPSNKKLSIWKLRDSSSSPTKEKVNISNYKGADPPKSDCPTPDGFDPCDRADDRISAGYVANGVVAWFWNVPDGDGYDFPHIRGARLRTSDLGLIDEPDIWNPDFAWVYPAVGVNDRGHVGLTLYRIGGGNFPRARASIVDDVEPSWFPINTHNIVDSTDGTDENKWGDYGGVDGYDGCPNSWGGAVWSMQGGPADNNAEHRWAWFGRERDGCPDLDVVAVLALPATVEAGDDISVLETTRNVGSATAGASTTGFYLSRDTSKSSDDLDIGGDVAVPSLPRGGEHTEVGVGTVPSGARGSYYLLACADDRKVVPDEISEANCTPNPVGITVNADPAAFYPGSISLGNRGVRGGKKSSVTTTVNYLGALPGEPRRAKVTVTQFVDRNPANLGGATRVGIGRKTFSRQVAASAQRKARSIRIRTRVRMPRRLRRGRYRVISCVSRRALRRPSARRCLASKRVLYVLRAKKKRRRR